MITGGKGLLASHLKKYFKEGIFVDIEEMDITNVDSIKLAFKKYQPDVVLHLAAYTDVGKAEYEKRECYKVNVYGTEQLAVRSPRFIYMSTEYVFDGEKGNYKEGDVPAPVNFYSMTKLLGEYVATKAKRYSIIRGLFKPRPYPHAAVPTDMWTSGDYVDIMAKKIVKAVENEDTLPKVINIGTGRKNLYQLALKTRKVQPTKRMSLPVRLPRDTSLNTMLWDQLYEKGEL